MCTVWRQKAKMSKYVLNSSNNHIRFPRAQYTSISPKPEHFNFSTSNVPNTKPTAMCQNQTTKAETLKYLEKGNRSMYISTFSTFLSEHKAFLFIYWLMRLNIISISSWRQKMWQIKIISTKIKCKSDKRLKLLILHQEQIIRIGIKEVILKYFGWTARMYAIEKRPV